MCELWARKCDFEQVSLAKIKGGRLDNKCVQIWSDNEGQYIIFFFFFLNASKFLGFYNKNSFQSKIYC